MLLDTKLESEVLTTDNDIRSYYSSYAITFGAKEEQNIPSLCFIAHNCVVGGCAPLVSS